VSLQAGLAAKADGIAQVERSNAGWIDRARVEARKIAEIFGVVTVDSLRHWADRTNDHPASPNAWGAIFHGGGWEMAGYAKSTYSSNHARRVCMWKLKGW
jgi:hypothetical protein